MINTCASSTCPSAKHISDHPEPKLLSLSLCVCLWQSLVTSWQIDGCTDLYNMPNLWTLPSTLPSHSSQNIPSKHSTPTLEYVLSTKQGSHNSSPTKPTTWWARKLAADPCVCTEQSRTVLAELKPFTWRRVLRWFSLSSVKQPSF